MLTKKINWERYFARKFCVMRFELVMRVFYSKYFKKEFNTQLKNNLVVPENKNHVIYYEPKEWENFVQKLYGKVCRNIKTFNYYKKVIQIEQRRYARVAGKMASGELSNLSWAELKKRFLVFDKHHLEFFNKPIWIPFPIEPVLSEATEKELQKIVTQDKAEDYQYYFENIFSPDKKNAINRENIDLLKIALKIKANQGLKKKLIKLHAKKYQWLPCYDINDDPWGSKEFTKMLDKILKQPLSSIKKELFEINKSYVRRCRAFEKILDTLPKTKRQKELFYMAHEMSFIKDERDDYRRLGSFNIQPLFKEIGRRVGLSIKEITQLTRSEMLELLDQQKINKQKCRQRLRGYVLLRKYNSEIKVFEGGQVGKLCHQELGSLAIKNVSGVKGTVGSVGKAKGPAQVIYTKHDLRKIKFGDIMIAVTTHPDFVPAMRRCKAVVTDEGGITCHASIVSRELKIPCIVGTQNATRIFKSGDTVEVDGFTGIVNRII